MTPVMIRNRERLQNITLTADDYQKRLQDGIASAGFATDTHSPGLKRKNEKPTNL
ncbi:hypothetical protein RvY_12276 [Ramazzottius varieornatus]|uniref:Uncharacterized protein n=1 Tax=Ramazzottius varieornatus TaxID=947166 RepID=A0A1D1VPE1_RAMVA|nr:hypothetical protein RvY_12276 [Ramazzottius varieornatus]